ncbi:MFS transporter [Actinokineospora iranica]|uniref:Predicted arabinose efflux permease, MFS family n=1 Tax=Actinokineospora iranica TaxID=1271860 RepID=A0A1G6S3S0_9PSEU|nr:MFS transporter [Actinokineospora iranica]SDD10787.1 Predicted arabinose efflux permease, MFS family [Actinokineospora iranica]
MTAIALAVDLCLYSSLVPLLPALPVVGGSPVLSGALFAVYAVALLAATPLVGAWVDRKGPRVPLLAGLAGTAAATAAFAAATGMGDAAVGVLFFARVAQGAAAAVSWTAGLALIAATHEPDRRGKAMGVALSSAWFGALVGPAASGALADAYGPHAPFVLIAVLAAVDAAARIVLIGPVDTTAVGTPYRALSRGPRLPALVGLTALGAVALSFPEPVIPAHLTEFGLGGTGIGLAFAAVALCGILAAPAAGALTDRVGARRVVAIGFAVTATGFALSGRPSAALSVVGLVILGVGAQLILAPTLVLVAGLAESVDPPAYGGAYSVYTLAYTAGLAAAPLAAGVATGLLGVPATMLIAAGLTSAGLIAVLAPRVSRTG